MKNAILFYSLLALTLMGGGLSAQGDCAQIDVEVVSVDCGGPFSWTATLVVSPGNSGCTDFYETQFGDAFNFNQAVTFGPFNGQVGTLFLSCDSALDDSCFTTIILQAPPNFPCNDVTECGITFTGLFDTISGICGVNDASVEFDLTATENYSITLTEQQSGETFSVSNSPVVDNLPDGSFDYQIFCADGSVAFQGSLATFSAPGFNATIEADGGDCTEYTLTAETDVSGNYTYLWNTGETTQSITVSDAGSYNVQVTDADNGCSDFAFITVQAGGPVSITTTTDPTNCTAADGSAFVSVTGGVSPYTFTWSDGGTTQLRFGLAAGTYGVTVTDFAGCSISADVIVEEGGLQFEFGGDPLCEGEALLSAFPFDNSASYTYVWTDPSGIVVGTQSTYLATSPGTYTIQVTNAEGCSGTESIEVVEGQPSDVDLEIVLFSFADSLSQEGCEQFLQARVDGNITGNALWTVPGSSDQFFSFNVNPSNFGPGLYTATLFNFQGGCPAVATYFIAEEDLVCVDVSGQLILNLDGDCNGPDDDLGLSGQSLIFSNLTNGQDYYGFTGLEGNYSISLPPGNYSISLGGSNDLLELCAPTGFILVDGVPLNGQDINVIGIDQCPRVTVSASMPILRRCFDSGVYIDYENTGTVVAEDVTISVEVGDFASEVLPWFGTQPSSIETDPQTGITTVTFELGDLDPFEGGQLNLLVYTCSADFPLGAAGCVTATASPNNPCPPADPAWSGASLRVDGSCEGDTISFRVTNVGDAGMTQPLSYIVIEDGVLLTPDPQTDEPLDAGADRVYAFGAGGSTYHFQVEQEPLHPGLTMPTDFVEACGNGPASYGFALQFPLGDDAYWIDEECNEIIGAYDPNDKRAMPRGYSDNRFIEAGEVIDYTIRFQNTGTDTAFNVVIRDTLSDVFDLTTLEVLGGTHDFYTRVDSSGRALAFYFDNIMLPDSFVNEPASHGAVQLRLQTLSDLAPGTDVDNGAAIYFDFNEPIFTNVYDLEVAEDFIAVSVFDFTPAVARLKVFPNPTAGPATLQLPRADLGQNLRLEVFDGLGRRQLVSAYGNGERPRIDLGSLPAGWYTLRLLDDGRMVGTGRVLLQKGW